MKNTWIQIVSLCFIFLSSYWLFEYWSESKYNRQIEESSNSPSESSEYFAGKTIEWIVPFKEGGGGDTWTRFNAPFLSKYLPGQPTVVVVNIPGGGSIKGANLFVERAKADGLMILGTSGSTQMPFLLDDPRVSYDYSDLRPIMAYPTGGVVYVSQDLGIENASELSKIKDFPLIYASQGPTSLDLVPNIAFDLLGLNVKTVFGFRGRGEGRLAFERGEVLIDYQTSSAYLKNVMPLVNEGSAIPLWSWGVLNKEGKLVRDPSFPQLPHFGEVYESFTGKKREGIEWDSWFATMAAGFGGMKLMLVPKETPDHIVDILRDAVAAYVQDPEYLERKNSAIGLYEQATGERASTIFDVATNIGQAEKDWCKQFLRNKYDLNI